MCIAFSDLEDIASEATKLGRLSPFQRYLQRKAIPRRVLQLGERLRNLQLDFLVRLHGLTTAN